MSLHNAGWTTFMISCLSLPSPGVTALYHTSGFAHVSVFRTDTVFSSTLGNTVMPRIIAAQAEALHCSLAPHHPSRLLCTPLCPLPSPSPTTRFVLPTSVPHLCGNVTAFIPHSICYYSTQQCKLRVGKQSELTPSYFLGRKSTTTAG